MARVHLADPAAADGAAEARLVGDQIRLAVGAPLRHHRGGADLVGALELDIAVVACRQAAERLGDIEHRDGALLGQAGAVVAWVELGPRRRDSGMKGVGILDLDARRAAHGNCLQILRAHHRADAGAPGGAVEIIDDAGIARELFAGAPDRGDADARILVTFLDARFGLPHRLAPDETLCVQQLGLVILDVEIDRLFGFAGDHDHVPAGEAQLAAPIAARIGARDGIRQGALGDHRITSAGGGAGAGQRARGENQHILGRQRIRFRVHFLGEIFTRQTTRADILRRPIHIEGLRLAGSLGEIDA